MKGFLLDESGDIVLRNGDIQMAEGGDLMRQTCRMVLSTNRGEWAAQPEEGISFGAFLGKSPSPQAMRDELLAGLRQVDESFLLESFSQEKAEDRRLKICFTAVNKTGGRISQEQTF